MNKRRILFFFAISTFLAICAVSYYIILKPNASIQGQSRIVYIEESTNLEIWLANLTEPICSNTSTFLITAKLKRFQKVRPGRYRFRSGMSNNAMINMLRSGNQEPVTVRTDDVEDLQELSARLGKYLQSDSADFISTFTNDSVCLANGFNQYTIACMMIPNTYEFVWTMKPDEFIRKMKRTYEEYWTTEKRQRAEAIGLSPAEVCILASIVKAETGAHDEAPKIAGLYLNRLRSGIALQSDPTAVFGKKEHAARVYLSDLRKESPYNTYLFPGLPPGPINFPERHYLDAVLNPEKHSYIYMCAQAGGTGYHNFSRTLDQHNVYRNEYTRWLEQKGIR